MHRRSAERTLGEGVEIVPVMVEGWSRDFELAIGTPEHYRCQLCLGRRDGIASADAQPREGEQMAAVAIRVGEEQLKACDLRETPAYRRVEIAAPNGLEGRVWIYQGRKEHRQGAEVLPRKYWETIEEAAEAHPYKERILKDRPSMEMAELELIRYSSDTPKGTCTCR